MNGVILLPVGSGGGVRRQDFITPFYPPFREHTGIGRGHGPRLEVPCSPPDGATPSVVGWPVRTGDS